MTPDDEVEDLFVLLSEVKRQIPSITAVSSGAIASDYQRLRVESICSRLGLVSLAFLWKQDQTLLLQEMVSQRSYTQSQIFSYEFVFFNSFLVNLQIANGIKAILVKVLLYFHAFININIFICLWFSFMLTGGGNWVGSF